MILSVQALADVTATDSAPAESFASPGAGRTSRIRLGTAELARLAELCRADMPVLRTAARRVRSRVPTRLTGIPAKPIQPVGLDGGSSCEVDDRLREEGLLDADRQVVPAVAHALLLWSKPSVVVELSLTVDPLGSSKGGDGAKRAPRPGGRSGLPLHGRGARSRVGLDRLRGVGT